MHSDDHKDQDEYGPRGDAIDLARLYQAVRARRRWILIPTLAAFAAALVFVTMVSPRYTAVTKVLLENQESYYTRPDKATLEPAAAYDPEAVQSEAESVATADLARKAVARLGLTEKPEFNPAKSANPLSLILSLFAGGRAGAVEDQVVDAFLSRLTVFPVAKSRVLQIEFTSSDPALAARGANTVAELFLDEQEEAKKSQARAASAWLSGKIDELRAKVADADAKVEAFRAGSGLLAGANGLTAPTQQLAEITTQIATARTAQSAATAKAQMLREMLRTGRLDSVPDVANDESLRRYAEMRVTLKAQIAEQSRTLLPGHPHMRELTGQLAGLDDEIRGAAAKAVRGFEDEARLAASEVASLEATIAKQSKTVATSDVEGVRLRALELDAKTAREQLESYIGKYREAIARDADNAAPANARVIATAYEPRSVTFPKKGPMVLLATLAGLFLSAGIVVARTLLGDASEGAIDAAPARALLDAAEAPAAASSAEASPEASVPVTELDLIVDRLAASAPAGGALTILVTGEEANGALAIALTAARRLARRGRAALVDLGASQPWLDDVFDRSGETGEGRLGLADLIEGQASFAEALHRDLSSRLDILPAGAGEIDTEGVEPALAALTQSYQFVVIHASDWRRPAVGAAIGAVTAIIVSAPAARLEAVQARVRQSLGDAAIVVAGVAATERPPLGRAA